MKFRNRQNELSVLEARTVVAYRGWVLTARGHEGILWIESILLES
jgi:hypothetical protein